jgi:hypothetical protein
MPGPPPKDAPARRRRNIVATEAVLEATPHRVPPLPKRLFKAKIETETRHEWRRIWSSPMAARWVEGDLGAVIAYIKLFNRFMIDEGPSVASEMRQQAARLGLDVMSRRRLNWSIAPRREDGGREAEDDGPAEATLDPREVLRAIR